MFKSINNDTLLPLEYNNGNLSLRFGGQYVSLFPSITAIVSLLFTSNRKSAS